MYVVKYSFMLRCVGLLKLPWILLIRLAVSHKPAPNEVYVALTQFHAVTCYGNL